jgi:hypothetical protein
LNPQIIYTNLAAKPLLPAPAPIVKATAATQTPLVKRICPGLGEERRRGVAARSEALANAAADGQQPRQGLGERPSSRLVRARRSESQSFSEAPPSIEMGRVERSSKLERIRGQRLLCEELDQRSDKRPALEHLSILHSQSAEQYWIADAESGEVFLPLAFTTLKHCHEAAAELERTFDIAEVLTQRPPETLERMEAIVLAAVWRERVELAIAGE